MSKIKTIMMSVTTFFKKIVAKTGLFLNNAYDKLSEIGKDVVPPAVKVTQYLKTFFESNKDEVIVDVISGVYPVAGKYAGKVSEFMEKFLPKLAVKLEIINSILELEGLPASTEYIMKKFAITENRGEKALSFAAELAYFLSDGKLTIEELKKGSKDYYDIFIKK